MPRYAAADLPAVSPHLSHIPCTLSSSSSLTTGGPGPRPWAGAATEMHGLRRCRGRWSARSRRDAYPWASNASTPATSPSSHQLHVSRSLLSLPISSIVTYDRIGNEKFRFILLLICFHGLGWTPTSQFWIIRRVLMLSVWIRKVCVLLRCVPIDALWDLVWNFVLITNET